MHLKGFLHVSSNCLSKKKRKFRTYSDVGHYGPSGRVLRYSQPERVVLERGAVVIGVLDGNGNRSSGAEAGFVFIYGNHLHTGEEEEITHMITKRKGMSLILLPQTRGLLSTFLVPVGPFAVSLQNPISGAA